MLPEDAQLGVQLLERQPDAPQARRGRHSDHRLDPAAEGQAGMLLREQLRREADILARIG